jgi:ribonucleotide reductase beta subunit family protein with ferritin-like domain
MSGDIEEILTEPENKYVMYDIKYPAIYNLYEQLRDSFWTAEEVDLTRDNFNNLDDNHKLFIKKILTFFVSSDAVIQDNLINRFMNEVKILESKAFFSIQIGNEQIHQDMYKKLLITYIRDEKELCECIDAVYTDDFISMKTKWAESWISSSDDFKTRLVAFACVEGIFFCSAFAAIYWIKQKNILPGLTHSNEFIARDECRHTDHAYELYRLLKNKLSKVEIYKIVSGAVEIECKFVEDCLRVNLIGMNADLMKEYVKFCADRLLIMFGYNAFYDVCNPFDFMEMISLSCKTNFFEHRVTEYQKAKEIDEEFKYTDDF